MRNEGKKNERRSTPPSFGILLLPRQIGSEHVLHHKLPSKQTKRKKDGFQFNTNYNIGHHRLHEAEEEEALERLSLFFFLSLSVGKKYTLQEGTASDSFCAVYITAFSKLTITLYNHRQHHLLPSKGRERERDPRSLSRAHNAREQLKRAWERYKTKKPLSSSYSYLKLTHSIIR